MSKTKKLPKNLSEDCLNAFRNPNIEDSLDNNEDSLNMNFDNIMAKLPELLPAAEEMFNNLSDEDREVYSAMSILADYGVTPEDYGHFFAIHQMAGLMSGKLQSQNSFGRRYTPVKEYEPLKDAASHTLILKIQMKNVTKPPMWREVEVPADFDFAQLHDVIQIVTGLEDEHMWQFNNSAFDSSLQIGIERNLGDLFDEGIDHASHDALSTPLTQFLQQKGDRLEYVYDFGDEWIFTITVKDLLDKTTHHPECLKFKSELNAIEDFGGVWTYKTVRQNLADWPSLKEKERLEIAEENGFDNADDFIDFLNEHIFHIDEVNDALKEILQSR